MTATIIQFVPRSLPTDGGKARIQARREQLNLSEPIYDWRLDSSPIIDTRCDLSMGHADNGVPCDVAYSEPGNELA